jgi:Restriction endonuclease
MSEQVELIYSRLVAQEKLRSGTPYERLAAITFHLLTEQTTVHDMRLRGESGVAHQLDVTVGDGGERKRILVECKDYADSVGLPEVRSFWAVVDDLKPDEAFMVTTGRFTGPAAKFAAAKGVTAAVLRPPREEDWKGIVRRIEFTISMLVPDGDATVEWRADPSVTPEEIAATPKGTARTEDLVFVNAQGLRRPAKPEIEKVLAPPLDFEGEYVVSHDFEEVTWLQFKDAQPLKVIGLESRQRWGHAVQKVVIGDGLAGLTAELALRSLDGSIHQMFSNREIQQWSFDEDGRVVPRENR